MEKLLNVLDENGVTVLEQVFKSEIPEKYADFDTEYTGETKTDDGDIIDIDDAVYTEDDGIQHIDHCHYCELTEQYYSTDADFIEYNGDTMVHESARDSHDLVHCYYYEYYIDRDNALWCTDVDDYVHEDYATYCEADGEYYYDEDNMPSNNYGKEYISEYHDSPKAEDLNKGQSPYSVGFEIEKTDFEGCDEVGDEIGHYEIFKGFETDSSCGVEAITNILPLSTNKEIQDKVFLMMREAESVLDSDTDISCGGHITISAKGFSSSELYDKIRSSMGLIYALWRFRIKNEYCRKNTKLKKERNDKYTPLNLKSNGCIEIRLPNRVLNVEQLQLRYKLIAIIVEHCLTTNHTFNTLLKKCTPVLKEMYKDNKSKIRLVKSLSRSFWSYLVTDVATKDIADFLNESDLDF